MKLGFLLKAIALVSAAISAHAGRVQFEDLTVPSSAAANRDSVVRIFTDSYNEYRCARNFSMLSMGLCYGWPDCHRTSAFGHDEVEPISNNYSDLYSGWGASIVDGMSTMVRGISISLISSICLGLTDDPSTSWASWYGDCCYIFPLIL